MGQKEKWTHNVSCAYCKSQKIESGCKHYRGGKTASDKARRPRKENSSS
jgi:hypothetical protein